MEEADALGGEDEYDEDVLNGEDEHLLGDDLIQDTEEGEVGLEENKEEELYEPSEV